MIAAFDSATPATLEQARAARAAGVGGWWGYLATRPGMGLLQAWTEAEFAVVRQVFGGRPVAFCSGWDDPVACAAQAEAWGVRLCLDVEDGIRPDGPWVQGWLDASGAGLYGVCSVHSGRSAAFHVLAWYPDAPPAASWYDALCARPGGPCGWQSMGTHQWFGAEVDSGWYDDWFGGGNMLSQDDLNAIKALLDAGTGAGQEDWAGTSKATLAGVQQTFNLISGIAGDVQNARAALIAVKNELDQVAAAIASNTPPDLTNLQVQVGALARHLGVGIA